MKELFVLITHFNYFNSFSNIKFSKIYKIKNIFIKTLKNGFSYVNIVSATKTSVYGGTTQ